MEKIKAFFRSLGGYLVLGLGAIVGILLYILQRKGEELDAMKARLALAKTQKEVDLIEVEIKQKMQQRKDNKRELDFLQKQLDLLAQKRQSLKDTRTDQEIEDYWNKK